MLTARDRCFDAQTAGVFRGRCGLLTGSDSGRSDDGAREGATGAPLDAQSIDVVVTDPVIASGKEPRVHRPRAGERQPRGNRVGRPAGRALCEAGVTGRAIPRVVRRVEAHARFRNAGRDRRRAGRRAWAARRPSRCSGSSPGGRHVPAADSGFRPRCESVRVRTASGFGGRLHVLRPGRPSFEGPRAVVAGRAIVRPGAAGAILNRLVRSVRPDRWRRDWPSRGRRQGRAPPCRHQINLGAPFRALTPVRLGGLSRKDRRTTQSIGRWRCQVLLPTFARQGEMES